MPPSLPGIDAAIARMQDLSATLDPRDGVACFNNMYLRVTRAFAESLTDGTFRDPQLMEALGTHFASLYLEAVDADARGDLVAPSWAPLFAARHDTSVPQIRFALAGMITHINHDLPLSVAAICQRYGTSPSSSSLRADYRQMNRLLAHLEPEIRASLSQTVVRADAAEATIRACSRFAVSALRGLAWLTSHLLCRHHSSPLHRGALTTAVLATSSAAALLTRAPRPAPARHLPTPDRHTVQPKPHGGQPAEYLVRRCQSRLLRCAQIHPSEIGSDHGEARVRQF
jgi:hypothetical protein